MSFDRMQSVPGLTYITPLPDASGNAGGVITGSSGFAPATTTQPSGGALMGQITPASATATTLANGSTITHNNCPIVFVTQATGATITGVLMQAGSQNGQVCFIINNSTAANTITFAAAGTSLVAQGTAKILPGLGVTVMVWNARSSLWY